jgi:hypothetical protein
MFSVLAPGELLTVTSSYAISMVFYGSLIDRCVGFGIALFAILWHIVKVIQPPEKCLILIDSLSPVKAPLSRKISHRLVYEC